MLRISCLGNYWNHLNDYPWSEGTHHWTIPSVFEYSARVREAFQHELQLNGFPWEDIARLVLTFEEAMVNAIKHGNQHDPEKSVSVRFRVDDKRAWVHIQDEGAGFDPTQVPDPTLPENIDRPSGRGVFLMRNYLNIVQFNQVGNAVFLCKFRGTTMGNENPNIP